MESTNGNLAILPKMQTPQTYSQADYVRWQIVGKDIDKDEFDYFLAVSRHLDLDPLRRQIYCVKRGNRAVVQTGIDGYRVIAARTGELAGIDDVEYGPVDKEGHPAWAKVVVWRMVHKQRCPFAATARWSEYAQKTAQGLMPNWKNMPFLMLGKCAEALALRKAFPEALSGIYTDTEIGTPQPGPAAAKEPEPAFLPPEGKTWPVWIADLAREVGIFDNGEAVKDFMQELTEKDPRKVKYSPTEYAVVAHKLQEMLWAMREDALAVEDADGGKTVEAES